MGRPLVAPLEDFPAPDLDAWRARVDQALASALATGPVETHALDRWRGWRIGAPVPAGEDAPEGADVVLTPDDVPDLDLAPYHRAGADAVRELAWMVALLYGRAEEAGALSVGFEVGRDVFEQVAKLRAARVLWHKALVAAGVDVAPPRELRATTAWRTLTRLEPMTNVLRATTQAYAAVLGGADTVVARPHEDSAFARRLAVHLQLVLRHEAHLDRVHDPLAGSYWVERRTDELARAAWDLAREVLDAGGLDPERARAECDACWQAWTERLRAGEAHVLGVSLHPLEDAPRAASLGAPGPAPEGLPARRDEEALA